MTVKRLALAVALASSPWTAALAGEPVVALDAVVVEGVEEAPPATHYVSPSTRITELEVEGINASTVEDFVKYEPGMVVRRRYIGDANGVVGMRGSNMFQTARTMVFADGLPLHYLLETQYNGSPRWSLVSPDETKAVEVIQGPFSAEHGGNAMGGVVNIETDLPEKREFHAEGGAFLQDFDYLKADDAYSGHREYLSYGDKVGDLSVYLFHNRLDNESQPMSFRFGAFEAGGGTAVNGGVQDRNQKGEGGVYFGDTGVEEVNTELTKLKLGYRLQDWLARFTVAYEERERESLPNNYLRNAQGTPFWSGNALLNGQRFRVRASDFAESLQSRRSRLLGGGLEGPLGDWTATLNVSRFDLLEDQTLTSSRHPDDPAHTPAGQVKAYDDTGWSTVDLKLHTQRLAGNGDMSLLAGLHWDHYGLAIHDFNSNDYEAGEKTSRRTFSGGDTTQTAWFAQWGWRFLPGWDLALGGRHETWQSEDGFHDNYTTQVFQDHADRKESAFSPKFSLGYAPDEDWQLRYSAARAYRFPIVEELFKNVSGTNGTTIANSALQPEAGVHQNLMAERKIRGGFVRAGLFHEKVEDVIFNQTDLASQVTTYLPVDEVTTRGAELTVQQERVLHSEVDVRFNVAHTASEITRNRADSSVEGNAFPRMPTWRANLLLTWRPASSPWDASVGVRVASHAFGQLDNADDHHGVFGAQDGYRFVDLKANYQVTGELKLSLGVDNVTNEEAFVAHPWPQRTFHAQVGAAF